MRRGDLVTVALQGDLGKPRAHSGGQVVHGDPLGLDAGERLEHLPGVHDVVVQGQAHRYLVAVFALDRESGLLWHSLEATDKRAKYTFAAAEEMCENLTLHGKTWRLPTLEELYGIVDYSRFRPAGDMKYFGAMMHRYYWTSDVLNDKEAYVVGFKLGSVATAPKKEEAYVRCISE